MRDIYYTLLSVNGISERRGEPGRHLERDHVWIRLFLNSNHFNSHDSSSPWSLDDVVLDDFVYFHFLVGKFLVVYFQQFCWYSGHFWSFLASNNKSLWEHKQTCSKNSPKSSNRLNKIPIERSEGISMLRLRCQITRHNTKSLTLWKCFGKKARVC